MSEPTLEEAVKLYRQDMINYAHSIIRREWDDAEDALQQALVDMQGHTYDPKRGASMKTWLFTYVRGRSLNYVRKVLGKHGQANQSMSNSQQSEKYTGRHNQAPTLGEIDYGAVSTSVELYSAGDERLDIRLDIEKAFLSLSEEERLLADLIFVQGYSLTEVARKLEININTFVRSKFYPMQARLRALLSEHAPYRQSPQASDSMTA